MRKFSVILGLILLLLSPLTANAQSQPPIEPTSPAALSVPCYIQLPKIYMVINNVRHHIADWDTFINLGYKQSDIAPCGPAANFPEGAPITRLLKGSGDEVYWVENGLRRHIPDMDTFTALGFQVSDITILSDDVMAWWPLGTPLEPLTLPPGVYQKVMIGNDTIQLWHHTTGLFDYATISAPGHADIKVEGVISIGKLPAPDITGEGNQEVMFLTGSAGSTHCCVGTTVYELGPTPTKILETMSTAFFEDAPGRGEFKDLNGDGTYEFITNDPLLGVPCSEQVVQVILQYDPTLHRYVAASPHFASYYADSLAQLAAQAAASAGSQCDLVPYIPTLLYLGKINEAQTAFDKLYKGADAATYWARLQTAVTNAQYYVPAN